MSFFLNPTRFAGTVQEGAIFLASAAAPVLAGASVVTATAYSEGQSDLVFSNDQLGQGAIDGGGEATFTLSGAAIASATASASAESVVTLQGGAGSVPVDAADFDGSNDYLRRTSVLTGISDSPTCTFSFWIYVENANGTVGVIFENHVGANTARFQLGYLAGTSTFDLIITSGSGNANQSIDWGTISGISKNAWHHCCGSVDCTDGSERVNIWLDDAQEISSLNVKVGSWSNMAFSTGTNTGIGEFSQATGAKVNGGLAEFWWAAGTYIDFTSESERRKFISSAGLPADLGSTGSNPTGTAPHVYLHLDEGETANNFAVNRGTGGNFTVTGDLSTFASSPSD